MRYLIGTAVALLSMAAWPSNAEPVDLAAAFGARPAAHGMALSPLGSKVLFLSPVDHGGNAVVVVDIATGKTQTAFGTKDNAVRPVYCRWKSEQRLVCLLYGIASTGEGLLSFTRVLAVDADGGKPKILGQRNSTDALRINQFSGNIIDWLPDDPTHVLMQIDVAGEHTVGSLVRRSDAGLSAQSVDINTAAARMIVRPNTSVEAFATDGHGNVRFRTTNGGTLDGYDRDQLHYYVRGKEAADWLPMGTASRAALTNLEFDGFDESGNWLYALKPLNGRQVLYKLAADGSGRSEMVFGHPVVDIDGVFRIGKYRRPVAAEYTVDVEEHHFFDPALLKLTASLRKAMPGHPEVTILDESWDQSKRLIAVDGVTSPGDYYLYNGVTHELGELLALRPQLKPLTIAAAKAVKYPAADGTLIPAYLTLPSAAKPYKTIIMPHGGPSSRDTGGFDWLAQYYVQLGYAVLQPNFRGSSGYGEAWYRNNGFKSWATAIGDVNDGARWMVAQGLADKDKLAIVGWSYGGYAALQANVLDPGLYKAVVAVAPVTDLEGLRARAVHFTNYPQVDAFIGHGPHIAAGSPARHAAQFRAPVLIFSGDRDLNVDVSQARAMDAALAAAGKVHELKIYPGLDHQLDDSAARTDLLRRSTAFLAANVK